MIEELGCVKTETKAAGCTQLTDVTPLRFC